MIHNINDWKTISINGKTVHVKKRSARPRPSAAYLKTLKLSPLNWRICEVRT